MLSVEMSFLSISDVIIGICIFLFGFIFKVLDRRITKNSDDISRVAESLLKTNESMNRLSVIQDQCQKNIAERFSAGDMGFEAIDQKIDTLRDGIAAAQQQTAVLVELLKRLEDRVNRAMNFRFAVKNEVDDGD